MLLGEKGFNVPDKYIDYDDENIDYSDIPAITQEDIDTGKIKWTVKAEMPLDNEVREWIRTENINVNTFAAKLIQNFYENIKSFQKNAAL